MTTTTTFPNVGANPGTNPLKGLLRYGQSPWMDYIRRDLLTGGGLQKMIHDDGLRGMTSNPTIFEKAITGSDFYKDILEAPDAKALGAGGVYEKIAIRDVQDATDIFKPVYAESKRRDGYVSLEVSPLLANDTQATIDEARRPHCLAPDSEGGRKGTSPLRRHHRRRAPALLRSDDASEDRSAPHRADEVLRDSAIADGRSACVWGEE